MATGTQKLPHHWTATAIDEIATLVGGGTPSRSVEEYFGGEIVWLTPTEIPKTGVSVISTSRETLTDLGLRSSSARLVPKGTVLLTSRASIGYVAIAGTELATNQGFALLLPKPGIHNFYLAYWLKANVDLLEQNATGTTFKEISKSRLRTLRIPIPPEEEQKRIVDEIETQFARLDNAVADLRRVQHNLDRYRASVLKAAFEGRLVPQDPADEPAEQLLQRILAERRRRWEEQEWQKHVERAQKKVAQARRKAAGRPARLGDLAPDEWQAVPEAEYRAYLPKGEKWKEKYTGAPFPQVDELPTLPEGWTYATTEQLAAPEDHALAIGPFGSNLKVEDYRNAGVPLVFVVNIRTGVFDNQNTRYVSESKAEELRAHWVFPGDILITKMGDPPGDACIYPKSRPPAVITADCIRWKLSRTLTENSFFVHAVHSDNVHHQILKRTRGVAQLKVSLGRFRTVAIPLPSLGEQLRIAQEIEQRFSIASEIEREVQDNLTRAERLRQAILEKAFTGRLVPQDPDDEPAEKLLERIRAARDRDQSHQLSLFREEPK